MEHAFDSEGHMIVHISEDEDYTDVFDMMESLVANSNFDWIDPEEINALTSAPIIGEDVERDEWGYFVAVHGRVFWYADYQILDPVAEARSTNGCFLECVILGKDA